MTIMYGNNAPGEGFRDVAVAVRGVGDCVLPYKLRAEEQRIETERNCNNTWN